MDANPGTSDHWRGSLWARLPGGRHSYWLVVAVAAAITGLVVAAVAGLAGGDPSMGALTPVVVATQPISAGEPVDGSNAEVRRYPALTLPPDAVPALSGAEVASAALFPGDIVTTARLGGLPIGDRTEVAIPAHTALPPLVPGDLVDVLVTLPFTTGSGDQTQATLTVATAAVVTDKAEHAVTIAVTDQELLPVASGVIQGSVTLALVQPGGERDLSAPARRSG
ncbi:SAF domain-containing protein [Candidatus Poriferisocius sp.]|uniref:SAF domain-containing protein n=1 Tax=Candidatus Poriferisocius sp. TaxID=3101276 RepID=UPI003B01EA4B